MKRIFTLLLALVMTLALAVPALAAEDVFEAPETGEAAAPEAPEAPVEEAPAVEAPAEAPDMPQAAAAEPEDTTVPEDTEAQPQTGKLTILGETDKLWFVHVISDGGTGTDYVGEYDNIVLQVGDEVYLIMDYRYTIQWDQDWQPEDRYGVLSDAVLDGGLHAGDVANTVGFVVTSLDDSDHDGTITIVENPNVPQAIPVTWTAPEGVQVKTNDFALLLPDYYGMFTCDAGYVPAFTGAEPRTFSDRGDGSVTTFFTPRSNAQSVQVDVKKATGSLNIIGLEDKVVVIEMGDAETGAYADPYNGLVGGMLLAVGIEEGYSIKTDAELLIEDHIDYEGEPVHAYGFIVPESGDFNMEIVKTPAPADPSQTGRLTVLGETDKLWYIYIVDEAGNRTNYIGNYEDIPLQEGDEVYLIMDYRYTIQWDEDWQPENYYGVLADQASGGIHAGDVANIVSFSVISLDDGDSDGTITIVENPNAPKAVPVTWTAPEGVTVETNDIALIYPNCWGTFICDEGYVPLFSGVESLATRTLEDGRVKTYFIPASDAQNVQADVRKVTGYLNLTDPENKVVYAFIYDDNDAEAGAGSGIVGGMYLSVQVEAGYSVKADVEPFAEKYLEYEGENLHGYYYVVPDSGDINMEIVKTQSPIEPPKSGTGWVWDEAADAYYYFVDGVQKFDYWTASQRGLWYYVGQDGRLARGFQYVKNSNGTGWYMFQTDNKDGCIGRMLTGWQWIGPYWGTGWFNTAHGGLNGQCTYTTEFGSYSAATGLWADGLSHQGVG